MGYPIKFVIFDWGGTLSPSGMRDLFINGTPDTKLKVLFPSTIPTLTKLMSYKVPVGIVSNTKYSSKEMMNALIESGLSNYIKFYISSSDVGMCQKPCKKIFLEGLKQANKYIRNLHPFEVLYVGNNYEKDVNGALSVGFQTAFIGRRRSGVDYYIRDVSRIPDVVLQSHFPY